MASDKEITEPFPIFKLAHRYLLYDADVVSYVRWQYNISGVLIGTLAQAPQQNVFQGLPLELMPEEARLLVDKGVAYVQDDVQIHKRAFLQNGLSIAERQAYQAALRKQGVIAAREADKRKDDVKKAALKQKMVEENWNDIPEDMLKPSATHKKGKKSSSPRAQPESAVVTGDNETLFGEPSAYPSALPSIQDSASSDASIVDTIPFAVTPTTSFPPLQSSPPTKADFVPDIETPKSYPLFKHLHERGYFIAPGLRFGCQYMAYPGDPLRFHSHFLCNGMDWDQEFDLLDLVGGGRLGTGVKKGFLIGGREEMKSHQRGDEKGQNVRAFCIEWGGM